MAESNIKQQIFNICNAQNVAVLATSNNGHPYGNVIGFAVTEDLSEIIFATLNSTCKFSNINTDPRVSIIIDNRNNNAADFDTAVAITAFGNAEIIENEPDGSHRRILLAKLPGLSNFLDIEDCVIISVKVEKYIFVKGIYRVETLVLKDKTSNLQTQS